ncbi:MAG: 50S ribosomal protein L22 [Candidatus Magasanikbacteria bacterium]|nr:50S ribosomal protein L22 [Candidatus Magasanikbacteria bacterium]
MQTQAKLRFLRIGPRKVRLLADLIRGMKVEKAIEQLMFSKKDAAKPLLKLLNSAIANAEHNHEMKKDTLVIKKAFVDGGPVLKRWMPRAMGRATPIRKRTSHITIVLEGDAEEKKSKKDKKDVKKDEKKEKQEKKSDKKKDKKVNKESKENNKEKNN